MSAPAGPQSRGNIRGRGPLRASVRSRGSRVGLQAGHAPQEITIQAPRGEARGGWRGASGVMTRGGRQVPPAPTRVNQSQQRVKPPLNQFNIRNKTWKKPASLNAAFQSHAGKVSNSRNASWRNPPIADTHLYSKQMNDLYQILKQNRERERKQAIKDGFLADPDKPTTLANAITPVGTCQDMCPEFERVERIVQLMVDGREKISPTDDTNEKVAYEDYMVKRFRRSAAGYDEQLPSDIRPPLVLQKTLDYLFNDVVGGPEPLATVHKFVWDRTRSVRNDFSIQQVTKVEDLKIAIDCFERIARFHILSLHRLSAIDTGVDSSEFDPYQEREQLNNTLLSLQYYYDDSRHKLASPNEAEFRAYGIVFEIQDQRPDVEDRLQSLPKDILKDQRIRTALKLHAAAANVADEQGPLRPRTQFMIAQANSGGFWSLVRSNAVSYLMACVAEVYFNLVRRTALEAIWKAYKGKRLGPTKMEDWTLNDLTQALGFDDGTQARAFCEEHEFTIAEKLDQEQYIDLGSVTNGSLTDQNPRRKQIFSRSLVEIKRLDRTLPAVINGMSAFQAQAQGFVEDLSDAETASTANSEPLFLDGESDKEKESNLKLASSVQQDGISDDASQINHAATKPFNPFIPPKPGIPSGPTSSQTIHFGKPSANPFIAKTQPEPVSYFDATTEPTASNAWSPPRSNIPPNFNPFALNGTAKLNSNVTPVGGNEAPRLNIHTGIKTRLLEAQDTGKTSLSMESLKASPYDLGQTFDTNSSSVVRTKIASTQVPTSTDSAPSVPQSLFNDSSAPSAPLAFSFATSPLFGTGFAHQTSSKDNDELRLNNDKKTAKPLSFSSTTASDTPSSQFIAPSKPLTDLISSPLAQPDRPPTTISTGKPRNSSLNPISFKQPEASVANLNVSSSISTTQSPFPTTRGTFPSQCQQAPLFFPPGKEDLSFLKTITSAAHNSSHSTVNQENAINSTQIAHSPKSSSAASVFSGLATKQPRQNHIITNDHEKGSKQTILDRLSDAIMLESKGLLEQFIEFAIEPIIKSSLTQLEDDESWEEARKIRVVLLRKKYFKTWRANARCFSLMRKGRDRRRNFAQSAKELSKSAYETDHYGPRASFRRTWTTNDNAASAKLALSSTMSLLPTTSRRRQSLPTEHSARKPVPENRKGVKRKRNDKIWNTSSPKPKRTNIHHRGSQIVDESILSAPELGLSPSPYRSKMDTSRLAQGSMLHDVLMKQARRQLPTARSDTTRTEYFRLKALGIDPDTPTIPRTKDRAKMHAQTNGDGKIAKISSSDPRPTAGPSESKPNPQARPEPKVTAFVAVDDDDAFFAQIRSVREALAESEQWFQSERQSVERSTIPQHDRSSPSDPVTLPEIAESPAQRKLREIKERGNTPSRAEVRLRALGDKALLPKGFWAGEGMGLSLMKGKAKEYKSAVYDASLNDFEQERPNGFARFTPMPLVDGLSHEYTQRLNGESEKGGTSVEDAIEL